MMGWIKAGAWLMFGCIFWSLSMVATGYILETVVGPVPDNDWGFWGWFITMIATAVFWVVALYWFANYEDEEENEDVEDENEIETPTE